MKRKSGVELIQKEIVGEIANALGRTAEKLIADLKELEGIEKELARAAEAARDDDAHVPPARCAHLFAEHERLRVLADEHRLNLMIQREAIGLRDHRTVYACYPIPPKLSEK